jgi:hypothetical protein
MDKAENSFKTEISSELEAILAYWKLATSTTDKLLDYCINSPKNQSHSHLLVIAINILIDANKKVSNLS